MDLQAPSGTAIYPIAIGTVDSVSFEEGEVQSLNDKGQTISGKNTNSLGGTTVWIRHPNGLRSYYAHLKDAHVKPGQSVTLDTAIGTCGNSGNARRTSSHLHLGVQEGGQWVDPARYIGQSPGSAPNAVQRLAALASRLTYTESK